MDTKILSGNFLQDISDHLAIIIIIINYNNNNNNYYYYYYL